MDGVVTFTNREVLYIKGAPCSEIESPYRPCFDIRSLDIEYLYFRSLFKALLPRSYVGIASLAKLDDGFHVSGKLPRSQPCLKRGPIIFYSRTTREGYAEEIKRQTCFGSRGGKRVVENGSRDVRKRARTCRQCRGNRKKRKAKNTTHWKIGVATNLQQTRNHPPTGLEPRNAVPQSGRIEKNFDLSQTVAHLFSGTFPHIYHRSPR
ncbi:hypothetical protein BGZ63DRAFT_153820 [Mariannaea sp. PMI_226]|nr:hypothetical protein BGZ63DRAFT_153820 [Mariannaea sp. PMI_226]